MMSLALKQERVVSTIKEILNGHRVVRNADTEVSDARGFALRYLSQELESKIQVSGSPSDLANDAALLKFFASEQRCARYNQSGSFTRGSVLLPNEGELVHGAASFIKRLLGPCDIDKVLQFAALTPGATTRLRRRDAHPSNKLGSDSHSTPYAYSLLRQVFPGSESRFRGVVFRDASKMEFVPKTTEVSRIIAKEPCINVFLQRGAGIYIRQRLENAGVDLRDQQSNRLAARIGSKDRCFATVDLSSASDNISIELVRDLLPFDWFCFLNALRTKSVELPDGSVHLLEKFSMSGNGFIFELETVIFLALARLFDPHAIVYGDDIILASDKAPILGVLLHSLGGIVNVKKSHWKPDDPFRESCGLHAWNGYDVTPFYVRTLNPDLGNFLSLVNQAIEWPWWSDSERARIISSLGELKIGGSDVMPYHQKGTACNVSQLISPPRYRWKRKPGGHDLQVSRLIKKVATRRVSHNGLNEDRTSAFETFSDEESDVAYTCWLASHLRNVDTNVNTFRYLRMRCESAVGKYEIISYKSHYTECFV